MDNLQKLIDIVVQGDGDQVKNLVQSALDEGKKAEEIMDGGLIAGMNIVGEKMAAEEMFIPEVLMSARAMNAGVEILKPLLKGSESKGAGTMVIGTVAGDLHDIGKNLVKILMEGAGFEVIDLGTDVGLDKFISAVRDNEAAVLGMSALLTTTMPKMKATIDALKEAGARDKVKILVGGAPVTEEFAKQIGADGYAPDAGAAVRVAKELVGR